MKKQQNRVELDHISEYKRKIMNFLSTNKNIVELCGGKYGTRQDGKIFFPYEYIPETIETTFTAVCYDMLMNYSEISTYEQMQVVFFVITHVDNVRVPGQPGLRYDLIAHEICRTFADKSFLGIGRSEIVSNYPYTARPILRGRQIVIQVTDFSTGAYKRRAGTKSVV